MIASPDSFCGFFSEAVYDTYCVECLNITYLIK